MLSPEDTNILVHAILAGRLDSEAVGKVASNWSLQPQDLYELEAFLQRSPMVKTKHCFFSFISTK